MWPWAGFNRINRKNSEELIMIKDMNMKLRNIPFSPPDMTEAEAKGVRDAILSGWITTGPRTKKLEKKTPNMCIRIRRYA